MDKATIDNMLVKLEGATFAGIDTVTEVKLLGGKKNPQQGRITKQVTGSRVMLFTNKGGSAYDNMVRRRLEQEGKDPESFQLSPRAWGERVVGTPYVTHKGARYLEAVFLGAGEVQYLQDGQPISAHDIEGLPSKQEAEQGGLERKVVIRTYKLESITGLRAYGEEA